MQRKSGQNDNDVVILAIDTLGVNQQDAQSSILRRDKVQWRHRSPIQDSACFMISRIEDERRREVPMSASAPVERLAGGDAERTSAQSGSSTSRTRAAR